MVNESPSHCEYWGWDGDIGYCLLSEKQCCGSKDWCIVRIKENLTIDYLEKKIW